MRKKRAVAVLSILTAFVGVAPAQAFPSIAPSGITAPSVVEHVQWRERRSYGRHRYYDRRYRHRHYRRGPNVGAIIGGLAAGAIIGGALAQPRYVAPPRRYIRTGNAHVSWCYNRYRSYRAYDNTFQPYHGPRRQCYSPYN